MKTIKSTWKEKIFYAFGNMGSYVLWSFLGAFVNIYATDCIDPGSDLIAVLGDIILACRIFDAFSDILMGIIIEKTNSKVGKARLWFGISIIPLLIVFFFLFYVSGFDKIAAIVMISVLYFLFTVVFYTMNCIGFNAMLPRISNDSYDQSIICTVNSVFTSIGGLVCAIGVPVLTFFGGKSNQNAWTIFILILIAAAFVGELLCFIFVKEKPEIVVADKRPSRSDLRKGLHALFHTKYFYIAIALFTINFYISLSVIGIGDYYAIWVLRDEKWFSIFGSVPMVTMAVGLLLTPLFIKLFGKRIVLVGATACVALGNIIGSCFPFSWVAGLIAVLVKGFGSAVVMSQLFSLAPDLVAYIEAKIGLRVEGLAASANSFGQKIGSGLGTAASLWAIALCGYKAKAATQTDQVIYTFITFYWWIPTALSLVLVLLASFWNIESKTKALVAAKGLSVPLSQQKEQGSIK